MGDRIENCSQSKADFLSASTNLKMFYGAMRAACEEVDTFKDAFRTMLSAVPLDSEPLTKVEWKLNKCPIGRVKYGDLLNQYIPMINELVFNRLVDHLYLYLSDILTEILLAEPNILKGEGQLRVADALEIGSRDELIRFLADRKVKDLSYKSLDNFIRYFKDSIGVPISVDLSLLNAVVEIVERRHLLVHNGGRADTKYIGRTRSSAGVGEQMSISVKYLWNGLDTITAFVVALDDAACNKFSQLQIEHPETHIILPKEVEDGPTRTGDETRQPPEEETEY